MDRRVSTQDVSWFLDLDRNNQLELDPPYQRRSVWSPKDRRFFLDTIFRGYPSPSIFLHKVVGNDGRHLYEVVDGKQRLETIIKFVSNKIALAKDYGHTDFDGKKWRQLEGGEKRRFWDYVLPVEFIRVVEGTVVNQVFDRLNRNSRRLERQELRHAKYDGWFITYAEKESEIPFWKDLGVVTTSRAKRMKDVQFISELLMVLLNDRISGFDQEAIDTVYADYDELDDFTGDFDPGDFTESAERTKQYLREMESAGNCITEHAKTYNNFYTLWSTIALNRVNGKLPSPEMAASKFSALMNQVDLLKREDDLESFLRSQSSPKYSNAHHYLINASGASTEESQRQARLTALLSALTN